MKAKLEFDCDETHDMNAFKRAVSATDAFLALHEIDSELRKITKYSSGIDIGNKMALPEGAHIITEKESELLHELADSIREMYYRVLESNGINMDILE